MTILASIALLIAWGSLVLGGFWRPGLHCTLGMTFSLTEILYANLFPSYFLANRQFLDFTTGLILVISVCWSYRRDFALVFQPYLAPPLIILAYAGVSCNFSIDPELSTQLYLKQVPLMLVTSLLVPLCIKNISASQDFLISLIIYGTVCMLIFLIGDRFGRSVALVDDLNRITELQPLAPAQISGYVVIGSVIYLLSAVTSALKKSVLVIIILLGIYVIASTSSRGQLVAIFPVLAIAFLTRAMHTRSTIATVVGIGFIGGLSTLTYWIVKAFELDWRWDSTLLQEGTMDRLSRVEGLTEVYLNATLQEKLLGLGSSSSYSYINGYCHCVPVEILYELGPIIFIVSAYYFLRPLGQVLYFLKNSDASVIHTGNILLSILLYDHILSLKQGALLSGYTFALTGVLYSYLRNASNETPRVNSVRWFTREDEALRPSNELGSV